VLTDNTSKILDFSALFVNFVSILPW